MARPSWTPEYRHAYHLRNKERRNAQSRAAYAKVVANDPTYRERMRLYQVAYRSKSDYLDKLRAYLARPEVKKRVRERQCTNRYRMLARIRATRPKALARAAFRQHVLGQFRGIPEGQIPRTMLNLAIIRYQMNQEAWKRWRRPK